MRNEKLNRLILGAAVIAIGGGAAVVAGRKDASSAFIIPNPSAPFVAPTPEIGGPLDFPVPTASEVDLQQEQNRLNRILNLAQNQYGVTGRLLSLRDGTFGDVFKVDKVNQQGSNMNLKEDMYGYVDDDEIVFYPGTIRKEKQELKAQVTEVMTVTPNGRKIEGVIVYGNGQMPEYWVNRQTGIIEQWPVNP